LAQTLARHGNPRRGTPISAVPDRERDQHLQPQSDHDRGAVLVPRHARRHDLAAEVWHIKEPERLPPVLSSEEVKRVLTMATSLKARAMLTLGYGYGLRSGEVVRLRAGDIDSEQKIIHIVQSKGRKDRHMMLPAEVLKLLRQWWKERPTASNNGVAPEQRWLFPGRSKHQPMTTRQFSFDCSRRPPKPRGCARRSLCIRFATALRPICSSAAGTFASFKPCSDIPSPRRQPATVAWRLD
jgi:integrase